MVDIKKEEWKNKTISVTSEIIGGDDYEIRIAGLSDGGNWKLQELKIPGNNKDITIKALPQSENGWLRIVISSKNDCTVKWQAIFKK
jgi:polyribonucleotide nucleotidyltransferase